MVKMTNKIFHDERLSFPTKLVKASGGKVEVYIIPDEKKGEVLKKIFYDDLTQVLFSSLSFLS